MKNIPLFFSSATHTLDDARRLPRTTIPSDWHANNAPYPIQFSLALDPHSLFFVTDVHAEPMCDNTLSVGKFVEGLWTKDVAEFFIKEEGSSAYQEFNLSPKGAWWSQSFTSHRVRDIPAVHTPSVKIFSDLTETRKWSTGIAVPRSYFSIPLSFTEKTKINVNFILTHSSQEHFYTYAPPPPVNPDFHNSSNFCAPNYLPW